MIEKAMQEAGEPPAKSQIASVRKPVTLKASNKPKQNPEKKKKTEAAAALLEKRKKYDPRNALTKGKKSIRKSAPKPVAAIQAEDDLEEEDDARFMVPEVRSRVQNSPPRLDTLKTAS